MTAAVTPGTFPPSTGLTVTCNLSSIGGTTFAVFDVRTAQELLGKGVVIGKIVLVPNSSSHR